MRGKSVLVEGSPSARHGARYRHIGAVHRPIDLFDHTGGQVGILAVKGIGGFDNVGQSGGM